MWDTMRGKQYLLAAEDSFSRYCPGYPIPNKEVCTVAKPDQLYSDNGTEFVNYLRRELFSEFKIQNNTTLLYNPSSNPEEPFHRTIIAMLRTREDGIQDNWDLWINV